MCNYNYRNISIYKKRWLLFIIKLLLHISAIFIFLIYGFSSPVHSHISAWAALSISLAFLSLNGFFKLSTALVVCGVCVCGVVVVVLRKGGLACRREWVGCSSVLQLHLLFLFFFFLNEMPCWTTHSEVQNVLKRNMHVSLCECVRACLSVCTCRGSYFYEVC